MHKSKDTLVKVLIAAKNCALSYALENTNFLPPAGSVVQVPLGKKKRLGIILGPDIDEQTTRYKFKIKPIFQILISDKNEEFFKLATKISTLYNIDLINTYRGIFSLLEANLNRKIPTTKILKMTKVEPRQQKFFLGVKLSAEQELAYSRIKDFFSKPGFSQTLLYGQTGSGKTEIYKRLFLDAWNQGKSTMLLAPSVGLAQSIARAIEPFCKENKITLAEYHHRASPEDQQTLTAAVSSHSPVLVVGVHKPTFLPVHNLGLIIIDEEHDSSYVWPKNPKIDTKLVAKIRAELLAIPILYGSATPSIQSFYQVQTNQMNLVELKGRIHSKPVSLAIVDLSKRSAQGRQVGGQKNFWISTELERAIEVRLERKEQSLLFLGRRGFNFLARCTSCQAVHSCQNCSKAMCVQGKTKGQAFLICHLCGRTETIGRKCNQCKMPESMALRGIGTKEIARTIGLMFPQANVVRVDSDCPKSELTNFFHNPDSADIVVGTQSIVRGLDLPRVSLVGLVWADLDFSITTFDSRERAVQQLLQVSGRNRGLLAGQVIIQTLGRAELYKELSEAGYWDFCRDELSWRAQLNLPPTVHVCSVEIASKDPSEAESAINKLLEELKKSCPDRIKVGSITRPITEKVQNWHIFQILLKGPDFMELSELAQNAKRDISVGQNVRFSIQIM